MIEIDRYTFRNSRRVNGSINAGANKTPFLVLIWRNRNRIQETSKQSFPSGTKVRRGSAIFSRDSCAVRCDQLKGTNLVDGTSWKGGVWKKEGSTVSTERVNSGNGKFLGSSEWLIVSRSVKIVWTREETRDLSLRRFLREREKVGWKRRKCFGIVRALIEREMWESVYASDGIGIETRFHISDKEKRRERRIYLKKREMDNLDNQISEREKLNKGRGISDRRKKVGGEESGLESSKLWLKKT